ncbi:MAG: 2-amino-4-hydroxy-6-hydroxymethyldihydropteridine diphosphokinase [Candidatus Brocadiales bacterium]
MALVYLGLGANLGKRIKTLEDGIKRLGDHPDISVLVKSPYYETEPQGGPPQPRFINAVLSIETSLSPKELLRVTQEIERGLGRERNKEEHWGPRAIDIDILLYDNQVIEEKDLKIPHPMMHRRRFVLEPLSDISPASMHPVLNKTVSQLLETMKGIPAESSTHGRKAPQNV